MINMSNDNDVSDVRTHDLHHSTGREQGSQTDSLATVQEIVNGGFIRSVPVLASTSILCGKKVN